MRSVLVLILLLLGACSLPAADPERVAQATTAYERLSEGRFDELRADLTPAARSGASDAIFQQMRNMALEGAPEEERVIGWTAQLAGPVAAYETVQAFDYGDQIVVWRATMVRDGEGPWLIEGLNIDRVDAARVELTNFSLGGRPIQNYVVLAGAIVTPIVCLVTAGVAAWRRRWGWAILSLFGVGQVTVNWATGEVTFQALHFAVLGAGFVKSAMILAPWMIFFAVPIPAILFWVLGRWRPKPPKPPKRKTARPEASPESSSDPEPVDPN